MEYASPSKPRKPPRRAPVSPSSVCETCRSFYRADTELDLEYKDVINGFPRELTRREVEMANLRRAADIWDQPVKDTISPDIIRNHLRRRQRVTALLHDGFKEEQRQVERAVKLYNKAVDHHRHIAKQKLPSRPPAVKRRPPSVASKKTVFDDEFDDSSSDSSDPGGHSFITKLPDGTVINEYTEADTFKRFWFHQHPQKALARTGRMNMVDAAEDCAKRVRHKQLERLQAEQHAQAAQLRMDLVHHKEEEIEQDKRLSANEVVGRRIVSLQSRESAASGLLSAHNFEASPGREGYRVSPAALKLKPPQRALGDDRFWSAATRAQAFPDPQSITYPATPPSVREDVMASPHTPMLSSPARMADRNFLEEAAESRAQETVYSAASAPPKERRAMALVHDPAPPRRDPQEVLKTFSLPPHPLAGAAARLQAAQRQINEGMGLL